MDERALPVSAEQRAVDERWMRAALAQAVQAEAAGEVPVGAVLVREDDVIAAAHNTPVAAQDPTAHAEILVLRHAATSCGNYRLEDCTLYVTLEPCVMCAGALVAARIRRLVFGARDLRFGGVRSKFRLADSDLLNHQVEVTEGVLAADCLALLQDFFKKRR
ncbi:MAG: tRNA adenosine(34) deaminase TadA [Bryobacteraceae bacterium]|nr:tRNA adenosine(34) deaminase TadA [Bryobacteraceae bacterium]